MYPVPMLSEYSLKCAKPLTTQERHEVYVQAQKKITQQRQKIYVQDERMAGIPGSPVPNLYIGFLQAQVLKP